MYCDILRNPVIVGILVTVVVYLFMKHKKDKKKSSTVNTEEDTTDDDKHSIYIIPILSGFVAGFLVWTLNESNDKNTSKNINNINTTQQIDQNIIQDNKPLVVNADLNNINNNLNNVNNDNINNGNNNLIGGNVSQNDKFTSYQMIGKGIQIPTNLPDAFLDMDLF